MPMVVLLLYLAGGAYVHTPMLRAGCTVELKKERDCCCAWKLQWGKQYARAQGREKRAKAPVAVRGAAAQRCPATPAQRCPATSAACNGWVLEGHDPALGLQFDVERVGIADDPCCLLRCAVRESAWCCCCQLAAGRQRLRSIAAANVAPRPCRTHWWVCMLAHGRSSAIDHTRTPIRPTCVLGLYN